MTCVFGFMARLVGFVFWLVNSFVFFLFFLFVVLWGEETDPTHRLQFQQFADSEVACEQGDRDVSVLEFG